MKRILPILLAAAAAWPAAAQNPEEESQRAAQQDVEKRRAAGETADEAAARQPVEGAGEVTYEQVLAHPDDVDLNFRWAKRQVEKGDVKGASATLERILMVNPALTRVRLTYAVVLYRLDSLAEARRELEAVKARAGGALRAEAERYLAAIERRTRTTHAHAALGVGYQYDDNRNAGPASGQRLFAGTALNLVSGKAADDTSMLFLAQAGLKRDLRGAPGSSLFADLSYYRAEQTRLNTLDLQAYSFSAGGEFKVRRSLLTPELLADHVRLDQQTYLRTRGARLRWDRRLTKQLALYASLQGMFHQYTRTTDVPTAEDRNGNETTLKGGAAFTVAPTQRLTAEVGYAQTDARKMYDAYERNSFSLTHTWLLGRGRFLLSGIALELDRYGAPDLAIAKQERSDNRTRFSWTFGQPLGFLGKPFEDLLWTASYEYLNADSNILNYAYSNNKAGTMLTYRWEH